MLPGCNVCRPEVTQLFLLPLNIQEQILSNRVKATDAINKITGETNQSSNFFAEAYSIGKGTTNTVVLDIWLVVVGSTGPSFGDNNVHSTQQPKPPSDKSSNNNDIQTMTINQTKGTKLVE